MRVNNIIIKENEQDGYQLNVSGNEVLTAFSLGYQSELVSAEVTTVLQANNIVPTGPAADLLDLGVSAYTADQIISRESDGYQGWSRHIRVHFPVADKGLWDGVKAGLEEMLSFLSGDRWELVFRQRSTSKAVQIPTNRNPNGITKVSLLSGGMDSLIGAIDLLEKKETVAFVSHYKRGTEGSKQPHILDELARHYGNQQLKGYRFYVQPKQKSKLASKEDSSRSRSFLFISLGIGIANAFGDNITLVVPENGLISLNVPLTQTRLSSHSTRTTHPYYFKKFTDILKVLSINNVIENPYRFKTKGEMMAECLNQKLLQDLYTQTISCSHPDISRRVAGSKPGIHCGYCLPCIIRQAAEKAAGLTATDYAHKIKYNPPRAHTGKGRDLRAFKMALEEIKGLPAHSKVLRLLKSGPLPFDTSQELDEYVSVYDRGMEEVNKFLK